jgi:hypothetical protein
MLRFDGITAFQPSTGVSTSRSSRISSKLSLPSASSQLAFGKLMKFSSGPHVNGVIATAYPHPNPSVVVRDSGSVTLGAKDVQRLIICHGLPLLAIVRLS